MIEVVFNDSAYGNLKMAQLYQWENATPECGKSREVFGVDLMLSVGDIEANDFFNRRRKCLESLWSIYPIYPSDATSNLADELHTVAKTFLQRVTQDDEIRIWYSDQPDEMCGLHWFMWELEKLECKPKSIYTVKLPDESIYSGGCGISYASWADVPPDMWQTHTSRAVIISDSFRKFCVSKWCSLQKENAPLRVMLNGQLISASDKFYDEFIYREICSQGIEFEEIIVIGSVLDKYQLGISDAWITSRINNMIMDGKISVISQAAEGMPSYHRRLRKK